MNTVRHPLWFFASATAPLAALGWFYSLKFRLVAADLAPESLLAWHIALGVLAGLLGVGVVVGQVFLLLKRPLPAWVGAWTAVSGIAALAAMGWWSHLLAPWSVPRWVFTEWDIERLGLTFAMPSIVWGLYQVASSRAEGRTEWESRHAMVVEVAGVFGIPVGLFVLFAAIAPLVSLAPSFPLYTVMAIGFVALTSVFSYVIVALIRRLGQRPVRPGSLEDWLIRIGVMLVAPISGLFLNRGFEFVFGHFQHPLWFVLAALGGIAFVLPLGGPAWLKVAHFALRCALAPFYAYFFLVFMPFLPLSLLALLALGFGLLMLAPLMAGVFVVKNLQADWIALREGATRHWVPWIGLACVAILPACVVGDALGKRQQFRMVMDYAYDAPGHPMDLEGLDVESFASGLDLMEAKWGRGRGPFGSTSMEQPYLSDFRDWAIFDNLVLSDNRMGQLKELFGNDRQAIDSSKSVRAIPVPRLANPSFDSARSESGNVRLDSSIRRVAGIGQTWLDLKLVRPRQIPDTQGSWNVSRSREYEAKLGVPRDVFVDDYTLDVGDSVHQGVLAERRTATWVYNQITSTNRDPGLLRYVEGSTDLELRVFPFASGEKRRTSIRFLHERPVKIWIGRTQVELGGEDRSRIREFPGLGMVVPEPALSSLPRRQPTVRYHFVLDASGAAKQASASLAASLEVFLKRSGMTDASYRIHTMNVRGTSLPAGSDWSKIYLAGRFEGGYFFERALKHLLVDNFRRGSDTIPVVVAVTDQTQFVFLKNDLDQFGVASPGLQAFFRLDRTGALTRRDFASDSREQVAERIFVDSVGVLKDGKGRTHLVSLHAGSVLLPFADTGDVPSADAKITPWEHAAAIALKEARLALLCERGDATWKEILKEAFAHGILSRSTAYLAMETATQENMLRAKQQEVLRGDRNMDIDRQETQQTRMSEPGLWILVPVLGLIWFQRRRRNRLARS
ncbi:MAG: MSEP-CTERM sorting domain-containing protein [Fibrobacterota bacterium]|nr:MAG: MSEP-CTERM sorting domain-containing protein [Fibrobacterota bacterium]